MPSTTFILIDDDKIISLGWKYKALEKEVSLIVFTSFEEFIKQHLDFDKSSLIYIDSMLGENIRGEVEAKKAFELGFNNIFITTGFIDLDISKYPWIKGVVSKKPPF